jgi:hypothetical protein
MSLRYGTGSGFNLKFLLHLYPSTGSLSLRYISAALAGSEDQAAGTSLHTHTGLWRHGGPGGRSTRIASSLHHDVAAPPSRCSLSLRLQWPTS